MASKSKIHGTCNIQLDTAGNVKVEGQCDPVTFNFNIGKIVKAIKNRRKK